MKIFLDDISRKYNKSLYLLPTSIHEMLLLFDDGEDQEEDLLHILEKSDQQLSKEEFLSDNIYYYDKYMGRVDQFYFNVEVLVRITYDKRKTDQNKEKG